MNKYSKLHCFLFSVLIISNFAAASVPEESFLNPEAILEYWESNYLPIKNMKISYTHCLTDHESPNPDKMGLPSPVEYEHVERIEQGNKYCIKYSIAKDGFAKPEAIMGHSFNGVATKDYWGNTSACEIRRGLTGRNVESMNLVKKYMLLNKVSLEEYKKDFPEGIPFAAYLLRMGIRDDSISVRPKQEQVSGNMSHVIDIDYPDYRYTIWFATEKGMLPVKYQEYKQEELKKEFIVEKVGSIKTDTGIIWYPSDAKSYRSSSYTGKTNYQLTTKSFEINIPTDDLTFNYPIPEGTEVADFMLGIQYTIGTAATVDTLPDLHELASTNTEQRGNCLLNKTHSNTTMHNRSSIEKNIPIAEEAEKIAKSKTSAAPPRSAFVESKHWRMFVVIILIAGGSFLLLLYRQYAKGK